MGFRLQQKWMTLNDPERERNGRLLSVVLTSCHISLRTHSLGSFRMALYEFNYCCWYYYYIFFYFSA